MSEYIFAWVQSPDSNVSLKVWEAINYHASLVLLYSAWFERSHILHFDQSQEYLSLAVKSTGCERYDSVDRAQELIHFFVSEMSVV